MSDDEEEEVVGREVEYRMRSVTVAPAPSGIRPIPPPGEPFSGRNSSIDVHDWFGEFGANARSSSASASASASASTSNTFFDVDESNKASTSASASASASASTSASSSDRYTYSLIDDLPRQNMPQLVSPAVGHAAGAAAVAAGDFFSFDRNGVPDGGFFYSAEGTPTERPLPEFLGSGGGRGAFRLPLRAAVHPERPPSFELRPRPLRESQERTFFRIIAGTRSQLWAGQENGVRFWNLSDVFKGKEDRGTPPRGDEETARFRMSRQDVSPTMCFAVDDATRMMWSGHKDGMIRCWRMDQASATADSPDGDDGSPVDDYGTEARFHEDLSWQAHRGPVLSMAFTSHGDLWSGSENGVIRAWPWDVIYKSLTMEQRYMSNLLVESSYVDLRSRVTDAGICTLPSEDVKFLLSDRSRSKIWSCGSLYLALWNSRTKQLVKVFGIDGQVDFRFDITSGQELCVQERSPKSFFQRSRNVFLAAADTVRKVATKGALADRKTEAIIMCMDGMIWTGCANGALVQWDGNGNRMREIQHLSSSVQCLCSFGTRLWVGYLNGSVHVLDLDGNLLGEWIAHSTAVMNLAIGGGYVFTLANHGGIRGWKLTSPGPLDDDILKKELTSKESLYTKHENLKILVGSWNVGQEKASHDSLVSWVGCSASKADVVVVGLQEIEMGAGSLAVAAAKETVGLEGTAAGKWWLDTIGRTLDQGTTFEHVGFRQLAGLIISLWVRKNLRKYIGDVDVGAVACGFRGAIANKGSVGLRMRVYDKTFCFLNCHFAAHLEAVSRRNADFDRVYQNMSFSRPSNINLGASSSSSSLSAVPLNKGSNVGIQTDDKKPDLSEADMIVFLGDLNYRLQDISYDEARDLLSQRCFDWLREKDQLRSEMKNGRVFQGMREGIIRFPPTYKFQRHVVGSAGYDCGEKKRIPAWCDRILYRDSRSEPAEKCILSCPVSASILQYHACMEVTDSDHKPIRCLFSVKIACIDEIVRRQAFGEIVLEDDTIRSFRELSSIPDTIVSTDKIDLQNKVRSILQITNKSNKDSAIYEINCDGQSSVRDGGYPSEHYPRGAFGFPHWLQVTPAAGIIKPGQTSEVSLYHVEINTTEPLDDVLQDRRGEDNITDKEVKLVLNVSGSLTTQRKNHDIYVRRCISSRSSSNKR